MAALLSLPVLPGPGPDPLQQDGDVRARSFAIPDTRHARALYGRAEAHVAAERWAEAIADLQELITEHRGEVLGARELDPDGERSLEAVHPGAAEAARRRLLSLPAPARRLYRDRFGGDAGRALASARRSADRRALVEVARRWPLTGAARDAWWTVGDLELELGNPAAARDAWARARALLELEGQPLPPGALRREAFLTERAVLDDGALRTSEVTSGVTVPGPGEATGTPPGSDCHSWRREVGSRGSERVPFSGVDGDHNNLFPVLAGDTLLVSSSLRLLAFDAWTGTERWVSDEPPGWDRVDHGQVRALNDNERLTRAELFSAIDRESLMIAPAASGGIAVAALQIPISLLGSTRYQNIPITSPIPDRRLFAFDLETGRELWNHLPPPMWDGESGAFEQRMRVAAPPVIAGTRIVVPAYRMQGRVDYHLACFDLFTGSLLWSTALISGQLPLNMFGRHSREFSAAPVRVEGDRVIALTQLGAVAAVDLYTGDVLWETLYEQIPLPATIHWSPRRRKLAWKNAAPVAVDGVVVATPLDSEYLIGLDLEHGTLLWRLHHDRLTKPSLQHYKMTLIGADEGAVYLAGGTIVACRAPSGLRSASGPNDPLFGADLTVEHVRPDSLPRPALGHQHVVAPTPARRVALDRRNVRYEDRGASGDWGREQSPGNALLGEGALFLLNSRTLTACFDWEVLEERARGRLAANPDDDASAHAFAALLANRARTEIEKGQLALAEDRLERAREILEPRLDTALGMRAALSALLHEVLRAEAEVLVRGVRWKDALQRLELARDLAPGPGELRDTLVTTAELLHTHGDRETWLATLDELERRCGLLDMPEREGALEPPVAVGLWILLEREREAAALGDAEGELLELHRILASYGDVPLPGAPREGEPEATPRRASHVIAGLLERNGRRIYAPYEDRARELLAEARASGELEPLELLIELYPHAEAAAEARDASIEAALAEGLTDKVVGLVQDSIPQTWSPAKSTEREADLLLRMGIALEMEGNRELLEGLVRALAPSHPQLAPRLDRAGGRTLSELAAELEERAPARADTSTFDETARVRTVIEGEYVLLGKTPPDGDLPRLLVAARIDRRNDEIHAFPEGELSRPLWRRKLDGPIVGGLGSPWAVAHRRIAIAGSRQVLGLDSADGSVRWRWQGGRRDVLAVHGDSGVVLIVAKSDRQATLFAVDATTGMDLWAREVPRELHPSAVCGEGRAVLLPASYTGGTAQVLDLFTGARAVEFDLPRVGENDQLGAWIEHGALVLPSFPKRSAGTSTKERICIGAWDLETGRQLWRVPDDEQRDFDSIARSGRDTYLIFSAGRADSGIVQQLDTRLGACRILTGARLRPGDVPIGIERHRVTELGGPYLFLRSRSRSRESDRETFVRALQLPYGEKWSHRLPVPPDELQYPLPLPALSRSTVVLAWTEPTRDRSIRPRTSLLLLDRHNGTEILSRELDSGLGSSDHIEFATLGSALVIRGEDEMQTLTR